MAAFDTDKIPLYVRSILWDLNIPQHTASLLYDDNNGHIAMANEGKPTPRTRHIDIKFHPSVHGLIVVLSFCSKSPPCKT